MKYNIQTQLQKINFAYELNNQHFSCFISITDFPSDVIMLVPYFWSVCIPMDVLNLAAHALFLFPGWYDHLSSQGKSTFNLNFDYHEQTVNV